VYERGISKYSNQAEEIPKVEFAFQTSTIIGFSFPFQIKLYQFVLLKKHIDIYKFKLGM
jgi:hypothetical protein